MLQREQSPGERTGQRRIWVDLNSYSLGYELLEVIYTRY